MLRRQHCLAVPCFAFGHPHCQGSVDTDARLCTARHPLLSFAVCLETSRNAHCPAQPIFEFVDSRRLGLHLRLLASIRPRKSAVHSFVTASCGKASLILLSLQLTSCTNTNSHFNKAFGGKNASDMRARYSPLHRINSLQSWLLRYKSYVHQNRLKDRL